MSIGYIVVDTWAGRSCHIVDILRECPKRSFVRFRSTVCARKRAGHEQFIGKKFILSEPPAWAVGERAPR